MKKLLICLAAVVLVVGMVSMANAGTQAGDKTVAGTIALSSSTSSIEGGGDSTSQSLTTSLGVGYFFTNALQLEADLMGQQSTSEGSDDSTMLALTLRPNYHFNTQSNIVPYVGATLGSFIFASGGVSESVFMWGAQVGMKQFLKENAFLTYELAFTQYSLTGADVSDLRFMFGVGFKL